MNPGEQARSLRWTPIGPNFHLSPTLTQIPFTVIKLLNCLASLVPSFQIPQQAVNSFYSFMYLSINIFSTHAMCPQHKDKQDSPPLAEFTV